MKQGVIGSRLNCGDPVIAEGKGVLDLTMSFNDLAHIPFQIRGGGCARLDRDEALVAELGDHEYVRIPYGRFGKHLIDGPGARDDGCIP